MISSGVNLVMTVIGFVVSTLFIVFVCTRLICARILHNSSRRAFGIASLSDLNILERGLHGLEHFVSASFPMKKYSDAMFSSAGDAHCPVCLAEYLREDTLRILPICGHYFHASCIDLWLQYRSTCPVCRLSLNSLPEKKRAMSPVSSVAIRPQYGMELLDTNTYHCSLTSHRLSTAATTVIDCGMDSISENQFQHEGRGESGESNSSPCDDHQNTTVLRIKHVESPSNP